MRQMPEKKLWQPGRRRALLQAVNTKHLFDRIAVLLPLQHMTVKVPNARKSGVHQNGLCKSGSVATSAMDHNFLILMLFQLTESLAKFRVGDVDRTGNVPG